MYSRISPCSGHCCQWAVRSSPSFSALEDAFLLINADRYRTGTAQIEAGPFPDVLTG